MEERLRTAETSIEVLKNKTKVSQNRIADLEKSHNSMLQRMNLWNGAIIAFLVMLPFYMELVTGR